MRLINEALLKHRVASRAEANPPFIVMKTSTALKSNSLMVCLLLSLCSVCVCLSRKGSVREGESAHNRLTFSGHITNLFIYFTIPLR